jgi:hypothetical protein
MSVETIHSLYPSREPIRRRTFALRHLILAELSRRIKVARLAGDTRLAAALASLTRTVTVTQSGESFVISAADLRPFELGADSMHFYSRGDLATHGARLSGSPESLAENAAKTIRTVVDRLVSIVAELGHDTK